MLGAALSRAQAVLPGLTAAGAARLRAVLPLLGAVREELITCTSALELTPETLGVLAADFEAYQRKLAPLCAELDQVRAELSTDGAASEAIVAVQALDNALSLLTADLGEEARLAAGATPTTFALFRASLITQIDVLKEELR